MDSGRTSGKNLWNVEGIEEVSVTLEEEGDFIFYKIICKSFHLTSFAVLLDVHGITEVGDHLEEKATSCYFVDLYRVFHPQRNLH